LEILPHFPEKSVDLVLTDPPYGIGESNEKNLRRTGGLAQATDYGAYNWDAKTVNQGLIDISISTGKSACIWGGNYYQMKPSASWLIWDKENGTNDFADCEMAWTNYGSAVRLKRHMWNGMLRKGNEKRYHPTQKPLDVILWAMQLSPKHDTILDPFLGSGTTAVAAKQLGRKCIGIELEQKYLDIAVERLRQEVLL
jgi:DNA modification methylase